MAYDKKMAKKNRIDYSICKRIYLSDYKTYVESTNEGYNIVSPTSTVRVKNGILHISGNISIEDTTPLSLEHVKNTSYMEDNPKTLWKNEIYNVSSAIGYWKVKIGERYGMIPIFPVEKVDTKITIPHITGSE